MSLRFFSDQCVPSEITASLKRGGHEVTLLREVLPIQMFYRGKLFVVEPHRIRIRE